MRPGILQCKQSLRPQAMRSIRANAERRDRCRGVTGADEIQNAERNAWLADETTALAHRAIVPRRSPRRASGASRRRR